MFGDGESGATECVISSVAKFPGNHWAIGPCSSCFSAKQDENFEWNLLKDFLANLEIELLTQSSEMGSRCSSCCGGETEEGSGHDDDEYRPRQQEGARRGQRGQQQQRLFLQVRGDSGD